MEIRTDRAELERDNLVGRFPRRILNRVEYLS